MAKRTVYDCDRCKKTVDKSIEVHVHAESFTDPAGSTDWHGHSFDLCGPCTQVVTNCIIDKLPLLQRLKVLGYLKTGVLEMNF